MESTDFFLKLDKFNDSSDSGKLASVQTMETATSTMFSSSDDLAAESQSLEKKKKKEKKDKKNKDKKSSRSSKSNSRSVDSEGTPTGSTGRKERGRSGSGSSSTDYSHELFAKMLQDAYGDELGDFGKFDDGDPFASIRFDEEDWGDVSKDSATRDTNSKSTDRNGASTNESTDTPRTGVSTTGSKGRMVVDMNVEDMFAHKQAPDDDEGSFISELTGVTAALKGIPQRFVDEEDEQDDPDLPIIMEQLLRECPPTPVHKARYMSDSRPLPKMKSSLSASCRPLRRAGSILSTTSKSSAASSRKPVSKNLRFSTVSIRHYERILTENPSTIQGPSIGIGWHFQQAPAADLDAYEAHRGEPAPSPQLLLSRQVREQMLTDLGFSPADMATAVRNNVKAREQRRRTVQSFTTFAPVGSAVKKIFNPFGKGKS